MESIQSLQEKKIEKQKVLQQLAIQLHVKERSVKECRLVGVQLETLPSDVRLFKSIGKAYALMPKEEVTSGLKEVAETCSKEIATLKTGQARVESEVEEINRNIQELAIHSPEQIGQSSQHV